MRKMGRIWNALQYGDFETKKSIGSVILFIVLGIVLIVVAGVSGNFYLFVGGMISGVVALIISQSFRLVNDDFVAQVGADGKKQSVKSVSVMKNGVSSAQRAKQNEAKKAKQEESQERSFAHEGQEQDLKGKEASFAHYNDQMLKKIRRKYHVKKDHRPILIDNSKSYRIKECPAFIWRVHNKVYLLLLEKEPRRICISRDLIRHVDYFPRVRVNRQAEYKAFESENMITNVYREFLPDYYNSKAKDPNLKYKNLYQIYPDIQIPNRSIAQVMDLLYLNFMPDDKITQSDKINGFFKRVYAANILYKDRVYRITEYKEKIEAILQELCYAEIPATEFEITLENLVKSRLISEEYAAHYMDVRRKLGKKTVEVIYRR